MKHLIVFIWGLLSATIYLVAGFAFANDKYEYFLLSAIANTLFFGLITFCVDKVYPALAILMWGCTFLSATELIDEKYRLNDIVRTADWICLLAAAIGIIIGIYRHRKQVL